MKSKNYESLSGDSKKQEALVVNMPLNSVVNLIMVSFWKVVNTSNDLIGQSKSKQILS